MGAHGILLVVLETESFENEKKRFGRSERCSKRGKPKKKHIAGLWPSMKSGGSNTPRRSEPNQDLRAALSFNSSSRKADVHPRKTNPNPPISFSFLSYLNARF